MVFPHTIPINPIVFNPSAFGNMVHRNVWNHTAQILQDINRMACHINENLAQAGASSATSASNCASSASESKSSGCVSTSPSSSVTSINGDTFEVKVEVQHFKPEEISVKLIDSNNLIVEGKHEERSDDHGYISRSFSRRYIIPDCYDSDKLESQLSLNGVLTIKAPRKPIQGANGEKIIPITLTSNILAVDQTIPVTATSNNNNQSNNIDGSNQEKPETSTKND